MIRWLFRDRYRPVFGSRIWVKYWAKRARLSGQLFFLASSNRRYRRYCRHFGERTVISPSAIEGRLERLSIGRGCAIGRVHIQLHADVQIGDCVVINDGCQLLTGTHNIHSPAWELIAKGIVIQDYAWIAARSIILPGITIGRGAVVGAGAVVTKSVDPLTVVAGNPAAPIGHRRQERFTYVPSQSNALFEAWLGPSANSRMKEAECE